MTGREPLPGRDRPGASGTSDGEENRTVTNIMLVIGLLVLVGSGIWLVDAMLDARRADECMSSGRRNCSPPSVNPPSLR
jgi:hypothetical protein